jgi:hypothetical protein
MHTHIFLFFIFYYFFYFFIYFYNFLGLGPAQPLAQASGPTGLIKVHAWNKFTRAIGGDALTVVIICAFQGSKLYT